MRWKWIIGIVVAVALIAFVIDSKPGIVWIGGCNLDVEFRAVDANTGQPVPGASILIENRPDFIAHEDKSEVERFELRTDQTGSAHRINPNSKCIGRDGIFVDTWHGYPPDWRFTVTAEGYVQTKAMWVVETETGRQIVRPSEGHPAKLTIAVSLQPKP